MDLNEETVMVVGLAKRCPFCNEHPECPLHEARQLPLKDRYDVIENLNHYEIRWILDFHKDCLAEREKK